MYEERRSQTFQRKVQTASSDRRDDIERKILLIRTAPTAACKSERLKWDFSGKRSARLDRRHRIIYTICEECYQQGDQGRNLMDCPGCEDVSAQTVNFLDITDYHL